MAENEPRAYTESQVKAIVEDEIAARYHPEFGSEWQEGGSLYEIVRAAKKEVWDHLWRYADSVFDIDLGPNPYRRNTDE